MLQNSRVAIIIPAYNEAENIKKLLKRIFITMPEAQVVIADDSPPAENEKLKKIIGNNSQIALISLDKN